MKKTKSTGKGAIYNFFDLFPSKDLWKMDFIGDAYLVGERIQILEKYKKQVKTLAGTQWRVDPHLLSLVNTLLSLAVLHRKQSRIAMQLGMI